MYDLLLKGGTVLDPAGGLDGALDVAVQDGAIARVAAGIAETEAARAIDVRGKIVTPGLIDLHAHVFEGFNRTGVNPDLGGVYAGVTTIVDAGSAGAATFAGFPRHILPHCHTEVIPFLHICSTGLATLPDIIAESSVNLDDTLRVVDQHRGLIRGIKARMVSPALEIMGMEMPRLAKRAARESGVKLMVHIGDTEKRYDPKVIRSLLPLLHGAAVPDWRDCAFSELDYAFRGARTHLGRAPGECHAWMARTERWKYVQYQGLRPQLFDLESDPLELVDRGDDPQLAGVQREMRDRIADWQLGLKRRTGVDHDYIASHTEYQRQANVLIGVW